MSSITTRIDLERLFKLRLIIARLGEIDNFGWWNTRAMLAGSGTFVYKRGFPRTHLFAQARTVFTVAAARCQEVFDAPGCFTLWKLPAEIEEQFENQWQVWLDDIAAWQNLFAEIAALNDSDVLPVLIQFALITHDDAAAVRRLSLVGESRGVRVPAQPELSNTTIGLLAAAFAHSQRGKLVAPYVRLESVA